LPPPRASRAGRRLDEPPAQTCTDDISAPYDWNGACNWSLREETLLATAGWRPNPRLGLTLGAGAILGGAVTTPDGVAHDVDPGLAVSVSTSVLVLYEAGTRPFVMLGASIGYSRTTTDGDQLLTAADARVTALVGKTFADVVSVYALGRAFGGPVYWELFDATGGDAHHYAVGAGLIARLPGQVTLFVEGLPLGERSLSAGAGQALT